MALKGYTIPLVDLMNEQERQFTVDREEGLYLGHPSTVLLDDGQTVLCVYPRSHGHGPVTLKKSRDGGKTWSDRLPVPDSWNTSLETPVLYRTKGPDGQKHILMFSGLYPIRMAHSEDEGETWSELEPIGPYGGIVAVSDMVDRGGGEYLAFFHDDGRFIAPVGDHRTEVYVAGEGGNTVSRILTSGKNAHGGWTPENVWNSCDRAGWLPGSAWEKRFDTLWDNENNPAHRRGFIVYRIRSLDGGLTWSLPEEALVSPGAEGCASWPEGEEVPALQLCEPGIVHSPDGRRLAMLLRENSRRCNSFVCFSKDGGLGWHGLRELPGALTGDRHQALSLPDGRILISFRDLCRDSPTKGDWVGWIGTFEDLETGREGAYRIRFMKDWHRWDCAYPALKLLKDGTVLAVTYGHWTPEQPAYVMGVRLTVAELDARVH